jgi:hypothetical protein
MKRLSSRERMKRLSSQERMKRLSSQERVKSQPKRPVNQGLKMIPQQDAWHNLVSPEGLP